MTDTAHLGWIELALIAIDAYPFDWTGIEAFRDWWTASGYPEPASPESWGLLVKRATCDGRLS